MASATAWPRPPHRGRGQGGFVLLTAALATCCGVLLRGRCFAGGVVGRRAAASGEAAPEAAAAASAGGPDDLLIYGAGYLGRLVAQQWLERHPQARVVAVTRTDASHAELRALGLEPRTAGADLAAAAPATGFAHVVFAAPPSGGGSRAAPPPPGSYAEAIREALSHWSASNARGGGSGGGGFVFTSSGGVLVEDSGGVVDETSPVADSPRTAVLLEAERLVRDGGGTVLRLAGLYDTRRGAHAYWLKAGVVRGEPEGVLNLLHYEDAAGAVLTALGRGPDARGELFLVSDGLPTTRLEIIEAARKASDFAESAMPVFQPPEPPAGAAAPGQRGKIYNLSRVHKVLQWRPRYSSFASFMAAQR